MSRSVKYVACTSTALASLFALKKVYAKENSPLSRVWMTGSKYAIPNGSLVDLDRPTPISWFTESGFAWTKIVTGPFFGAAVTSDKKAYIWAFNKETETSVPPRLLESALRIRDIASTEDFVIVLEQDGSVVAFYDPVSAECISRIACPSNSWLKANKFVSLTAGKRHIALLDSQGQVWTAGDNTDGQCGRAMEKRKKNIDRFNFYKEEMDGVVEKLDFPKTLELVFKGASSVVCGGHHTVIVTNQGKALSFGDDSKIQLGLGDTRSQDVPEYVPHSGMGRLDGEVSDMAKLFQNTMPAVKYTFYDRHIRHRPSEMKIPEKDEVHSQVSGAVLGEYFTVLKMGDSGLMLACGQNQHGQCGRGLNKQHQTFSSVKLPKQIKSVDVSCGSNHCIASLEDGSIYAWGGNSAGQLGIGNRASACPPVVIHRSKIRGPLVQDIITRIGKEPDRSAGDINEFLEERKRDSLKAEAMLTGDLHLPLPPGDTVKKESRIKEDLIDAIDRSRSDLMMSPDEQQEWNPVKVHASFNNSIIIMQRTKSA